jgi:hypothetical protein
MKSNEMIAICPEPNVWSEFYLEIQDWAIQNSVNEPPKPLILAGWAFSSDAEKENRWNQTIEWVRKNQLEHLLDTIKNKDMYKVAPSEKTTHSSSYEDD